MGKFAALLFGAFATTTVFAAPATNATVPASGNATDPNVDPVCFDAPDQGQDVSKAIDTCSHLFKDFLKDFPNGENYSYTWTSDNTKWKESDVQHLPWLDRRIDTNRTHACVFDIIDLTFVGDKYPPINVAAHGEKILDKCFTKDKCGAIVLGPNFTTRLTVCATIHSETTAANTGVLQGISGCDNTVEKPKCEKPFFSSVQTAGRV